MSLPRAEFTLAATLLLAFGCSLGLRAEAASSDRLQAVDLDAQNIEGTLAEDGDVRLSGQVSIRQGTLDIAADTAVLTRVQGEVSRVVFEGAPAVMKQIDDAGAPINVRARKVTYSPQSNEVLLEGGVEVDQPQGMLRGERVTYDLASGRLRADGAGTDGRIRMRIEPRAATPAGTP